MGELVFIPHIDNFVKNFPIGVDLCNEVRPYKIPLIAYFWGE